MSDTVLCYFDVSTRTQEETDLLEKERRSLKEEKWLICRRCKQLITSESDAININEQHIHTFMNPAGIIYTFGCFQNAKGCVSDGKSTLEYSWFRNYSWQIALCSGCHEHLGWFFQNGQKFFALILDKLMQS